GTPLREATVTDSTILGGQTMRAYVADWSALGSGERPWSTTAAAVDVLDVADLDSERAHTYDLYGAHDREEILKEGTAPGGAPVVDGGRSRRVLDRFTVHLRPGTAVRGIVRLDGTIGAQVRVLAGGRQVATFDVDDVDWTERSFEVPANLAAETTHVELRVYGAPGSYVTTYHYWFVTAD
ncbi:MAG: hypothetical protein ACRENE_24985, partial [Polyangiaceae bacterium]